MIVSSKQHGNVIVRGKKLNKTKIVLAFGVQIKQDFLSLQIFKAILQAAVKFLEQKTKAGQCNN